MAEVKLKTPEELVKTGADPVVLGIASKGEIRRRRVAELKAQGWTNKAIAADLGVSPSLVSRDCVELEIAAPPKSRPPRVEQRQLGSSAEIRQRRRKVAALRNSGLSQRAIAKMCGVSLATISNDYRQISVVPLNPAPPCPNCELGADGLQPQIDALLAARRFRFKGRRRTAKLTTDDALIIRKRFVSGGATQAALAREYGVSSPAIGMVLRGYGGRLWNPPAYKAE